MCRGVKVLASWAVPYSRDAVRTIVEAHDPLASTSDDALKHGRGFGQRKQTVPRGLDHRLAESGEIGTGVVVAVAREREPCVPGAGIVRSEEHTSELQSPCNLV